MGWQILGDGLRGCVGMGENRRKKGIDAYFCFFPFSLFFRKGMCGGVENGLNLVPQDDEDDEYTIWRWVMVMSEREGG